MGIRSGRSAKDLEPSNFTFKILRRTYVIWLIGILVGVLGIQPSNFQIGGLQMSLTHPDAIQGVIYMAALGHAAIGFLAFYIEEIKASRRSLRLYIFNSLRPGRTSLKYPAAEIRKIKGWARKRLRQENRWTAVALSIPVASIFAAGTSALWQALKVMLGLT